MGCIFFPQGGFSFLGEVRRWSGLSLRRMKSCSAVAWNPLKSMQLVGACDHHLSPTLLRWELQHPKSPSELLGHEQVQPLHDAVKISHYHTWQTRGSLEMPVPSGQIKY